MSWHLVRGPWEPNDNYSRFPIFGFLRDRLFVASLQSDDLFEFSNYTDPSLVSYAVRYDNFQCGFGGLLSHDDGRVFDAALIAQATWDPSEASGTTLANCKAGYAGVVVPNAGNSAFLFSTDDDNQAYHTDFLFHTAYSMPRIDWPCFGPWTLSGIQSVAVARGCLFAADFAATPKVFQWSGDTGVSAKVVHTAGSNDRGALVSDTSDVLYVPHLQTAANKRKIYKFNWATAAFDLVATNASFYVTMACRFGDPAVKCYGGHAYAILSSWTETSPSGLWLGRLHLDQTADNCASLFETIERVEQAPNQAHSLPGVGLAINSHGVVLVINTAQDSFANMESIWCWDSLAASAASAATESPLAGLQRLGLWSHQYAGYLG